ncbi:hypothetical protein SVIOM342S_00413 [Streptomyces violaceorubidus]
MEEDTGKSLHVRGAGARRRLALLAGRSAPAARPGYELVAALEIARLRRQQRVVQETRHFHKDAGSPPPAG